MTATAVRTAFRSHLIAEAAAVSGRPTTKMTAFAGSITPVLRNRLHSTTNRSFMSTAARTSPVNSLNATNSMLFNRSSRTTASSSIISRFSSLSTTYASSSRAAPLPTNRVLKPRVKTTNSNSLLAFLPMKNLQQQQQYQQQLRCLSSQLPDSNRTPTPTPKHNRNNRLGLLGTGASAAVFLFGKTKYVFAALKLTKLASLGSMLVTVGAYSMFFGWPYAVGMVGLITVHEAGHALVMLQRGIPFSPMVFVPFMGAAIQMNRHPRDAWEDALVAFGGPVLGSFGAAAVGVAGHATDSQLLIALADFGFMINLFNLLPLGSMDGGRIGGALSPWMNVAGLAGGVGLAYTGAIHNPVFYLILLAGGYETFMKFYDPAAYLSPNYYKITPGQRAAIGLGYVGLIGSLALAMDINERYKKSPEQLIREQEGETTW
eukprot:CAMPEP_0113481796 /NCGR_PEP_ID=MMETSP0014_2-20120614/22590_1 /TAXON_ID=2857 /ORGANISM="Nitzschia sp." /LENGTH=430 /DNA_ID=CAMNT_0000375297 /DNA_START=63 /DNA_END=1352 /DNA_ORIENTATION=- /assembly_acc=CAM_ASM_000159